MGNLLVGRQSNMQVSSMLSMESIFLLLEIVSLSSPQMIIDFTSSEAFGETEASLWYESSDTVRTPGMSKAVFGLQKSKLFQRANFFALLNPQDNGACFAGIKRNITFEVVLTDSEFV